MNSVIVDSWYFFKNNIKKLTIFAFPFFLISIAPDIIGINNPKSIIADAIVIVDIIFIMPFYTGSLLILISHLVKNEDVAINSIVSRVIPLWFPLFLVTLFSSLIILGGFLALIIPGVWLMIRLFLSPLYVIFQGQSATQAIGTAYNDSAPYLSKFFFALLPLVLLVIYLGVIGFNTPKEPSYILTILNGLLGEFLFIFISIIQFRLYTLYIEDPENPE